MEPILYHVFHGDEGQCLITFDGMKAYQYCDEVDGHMETMSDWDDIKMVLGELFTPEQVETLYNERSLYYTQGVM